MAIHELDYWYGRQMVRFLEQVVRGFSGFNYSAVDRNGGPPVLRMVPCEVASKDRLVGMIQKNNSQNVVNSVPRITIQHTDLSYDQNRLQSPTHIMNNIVFERERLPDGSGYSEKPGVKYTVESLIGRPFNMRINVDIWTSNMDQKYQLMEQILPVVSPYVEIQNSDNPLDPTAKTELRLVDINWSSRNFPISDTELEIATLTFEIQMHLIPPAKVSKVSQVETIVLEHQQGGDAKHQVVTLGDYRIGVSMDTITLLTSAGLDRDEEGNLLSWKNLIDNYGALWPMSSQIRLSKNLTLSDEDEIVGRVEYHPSNPNQLLWVIDPDTLPSNTMSPVERLINPLDMFPHHNLPAPIEGQRYLLANDIRNMAAWGNLVAKAGDVIQYMGGSWTVAFRSDQSTSTQYLVNLYTGKQLKWTPSGWVMSIDGVYSAGYWRFIP